MTTPSRTCSRCGYTSGCWVTSTLPTIEVNICAKGSLELTTAMGAIERKEVLGFLLNMGFYLTQSCLCCFKFLCCHNGFVGILMINPVFLWNSALGLRTDHHALTSVIHHATGVLDILQHIQYSVMSPYQAYYSHQRHTNQAFSSCHEADLKGQFRPLQKTSITNR